MTRWHLVNGVYQCCNPGSEKPSGLGLISTVLNGYDCVASLLVFGVIYTQHSYNYHNV
ncbi:hypothetical protein [Tunturiibacter gelidiferens]|uniref:hypothetical protein n=1 Tax=Tunturiibacter gelidiferens TaxID=3069689 RepID=UPI003D9B362E